MPAVISETGSVGAEGHGRHRRFPGRDESPIWRWSNGIERDSSMNKWSLLCWMLLSSPALADWEWVLGPRASMASTDSFFSLSDMTAGKGAGYGIGFDSSYWVLDDDELARLSLVLALHYVAGSEQGLRPFVFVEIVPAWGSLSPAEGWHHVSNPLSFSGRAGVGVLLEQHRVALESIHFPNLGIVPSNGSMSALGVSYRYNF